VGEHSAVEVRPITGADIEMVATFLHERMSRRISPGDWSAAMRVPWKVDPPNHGFLLDAGGRVVGVYLAFYSNRIIDGRVERFCNLGAWCVDPDYRFQSVRLVRALLAQEGLHFTDLSPSGAVVPLNSRLKFRFLDTMTALVPNLPWPTWPGRYHISTNLDVIEANLSGEKLDLFRDHLHAPAARHVLLRIGDESCYIVYRRDRRKNLPVFASILHVSDPAVFRRGARALSRHLLLRRGVLVMLTELRIVGHRPLASFMLRSARPKMYRSNHLGPEHIDNMYSELVCVKW
jgi:hypothetical protein